MSIDSSRDDFDASLPAIPFTAEDNAEADTWHHEARLCGILTRIESESASFPEVLNVCPPFSRVERWAVWRNAAGVWMNENNTSEAHGFDTVGAALEAIGHAVAAEQAAFIATIPETLVPPVGDLMANLKGTGGAS